MKPIPYKTAVFLLTCKADQGKKSSGFQRFIIKWKRDCFISDVKLRWEYDALPHALIAGGTGGVSR